MAKAWDKRVAVIGDNHLVCKAIKLALHTRLNLEVVAPESCGIDGSRDGATLSCDMIIVVITSEEGEPIAILAEESLLRWIGRIPLLIASSRPFAPSVEFELFHMRFPFDLDQLCDRVRILLEASRVSDGASPVPKELPC